MKKYIRQSEQIVDTYEIDTYRGYSILKVGYGDISKLSQSGYQDYDIDYRGYTVASNSHSPVFNTLEEVRDYIDMCIELFGGKV